MTGIQREKRVILLPASNAHVTPRTGQVHEIEMSLLFRRHCYKQELAYEFPRKSDSSITNKYQLQVPVLIQVEV